MPRLAAMRAGHVFLPGGGYRDWQLPIRSLAGSDMSQSSSLRAVLYALGANFGIFVAKSAAAVVTGSSAMLAESIHSLADCGNQVLLLRGIKEAKRPPDREHPLGYGRVAYFWAFLVAVMLFTLGGSSRSTKAFTSCRHPSR